MNPRSRIFVAGHQGLVGSAIVRHLDSLGCDNIVLRTHEQLDLEEQRAVFDFFKQERPEYVFLAAAKVGGILANNAYPADFIRSNLAIQCNVIEAAHRWGVTGLMFLGSSCIYPKHAPQPMKEDYLLTGELEPTNQPYAVAKIAGVEMCRSYRRQYGSHFIGVMPTNLYGPGDNFDLESSHVMPALIRKFHEARIRGDASVVVWGTGRVRREFLHVDDMANACVFMMRAYEREPLEEHALVNVGCGEDLSIGELATMVKEIVGFSGELVYDTSKPDGTPRKLLDISRLRALGWEPRVDLRTGLRETYDWYLNEHHAKRGQLNLLRPEHPAVHS